ncbi:MAG: DUF1640 domain-containing protein [Magnetococcales bacterium]|nr:DUF1640 domain-containing protein [Magnetococcales bacterium]
MTTVTFDTLKFVETLKVGDFSEKQAKALSEALKEAQEARLDELASKADLLLEVERIRRDIAETKADVIKWVVGSAGVVIAILKFAP